LDRWSDERHRLGLTSLGRYDYERCGARDFLAGAGARQMDMYLAHLLRLDGGWLATRCEFLVAGKLTPTEEYQDWKVSVELRGTRGSGAHRTARRQHVATISRVARDLDRYKAVAISLVDRYALEQERQDGS
jgi:hypothetical protein